MPSLPFVIKHHSEGLVSFLKNEENFPFLSLPPCLMARIMLHAHGWPNPSLSLGQLTFTPGSGNKAAFPEGPSACPTVDPVLLGRKRDEVYG